LTLQPTSSLKITLAAAAQWRQNTADAVYTLPDVPVPNTAGRPGAYTGSYGQFRLDWTIDRATPFCDRGGAFRDWRCTAQSGGPRLQLSWCRDQTRMVGTAELASPCDIRRSLAALPPYRAAINTNTLPNPAGQRGQNCTPVGGQFWRPIDIRLSSTRTGPFGSRCKVAIWWAGSCQPAAPCNWSLCLHHTQILTEWQ